MLGGKSLPAKLIGWPFYLARNYVRPRVNRVRQARSGHLLAVEIRSWVGLFAHLEYFLEIALHCERHGLTPCFMSTSPQYVDPQRGPDWFAYFFTNPLLSPEDEARVRRRELPICRIEGMAHLGLPEDYDRSLTLDNAPPLVQKYFGLRPSVVAQVDAFVEAHLKDCSALGIHYRGTDKRAEGPRLRYAAVRDAIDRFLTQRGRIDCMFVSSDEQAFVEFLQDEFRHTLPVVCHDDQERSRTDTAVHRSKKGDRFRKAEEAVLNCLLLSRCEVLIKTPSFLSAWSKLFNPALEVIMLTRSFPGQLWFPDRELVQQTPSEWLLS